LSCSRQVTATPRVSGSVGRAQAAPSGPSLECPYLSAAALQPTAPYGWNPDWHALQEGWGWGQGETRRTADLPSHQDKCAELSPGRRVHSGAMWPHPEIETVTVVYTVSPQTSLPLALCGGSSCFTGGKSEEAGNSKGRNCPQAVWPLICRSLGALSSSWVSGHGAP
jgi:hypothetical protein